ncbi:MAG: ABC transporter substrate-binding protein [Proteobacteria bacterium]|nr:ABC transporter substrate-binding protein [Pseudomonadota bacterium]
MRLSHGLAIALLTASATIVNGTSAFSQDAKDTLRVAMYSKAPPRGNVYGIQYIWPSNYWWEGVFDSFVRVNDKGEVLPFAAESWKLVNPTTWQVTFRRDAEFTSGRLNDAENVVKIFEYLHSDDGRKAGIMRNMKLASYKVVGPQTVEFVTQQPDPLFIPKLAAYYISDMNAYNEMGAANFANAPVTSGPYRVVSWTDQEMVATAYEKSWRPAKIKNLKITEIPDRSARVAALQSDQVDLAFNLSPDNMKSVRASGQKIIVTPGPLVESIAMFTRDFAGKWGGKPPFADKRVRLAANLALNRVALTRDFFQGEARPGNQPATPGINGYNPRTEQYPFDPERAKKLLSEAGFPNGFKVIMETSTGMAGGEETLQIVAGDLAKVGIDVELRAMPFSNWSKLFNGKAWEGDMTAFAMFFSPVMDAAVVFSVYGCGLPHHVVCIPELNDLIAAQEKEMDPVKRKALLQDLMQKSHDEVLSMPIIEGIDITGVSKRVDGYTNWGRVVVYENMSLND